MKKIKSIVPYLFAGTFGVTNLSGEFCGWRCLLHMCREISAMVFNFLPVSP